jgi:hypothetical protein
MGHAASAGDCREQLMLCSTCRDVEDAACCDATTRAPAQPFAWQGGSRVLLLDRDDSSWLLAELSFDQHECLYTEIRRASYESQREAIGALLSRALASGETALVDAVERLDRYMTQHYRVGLINA